MDTSVKDSSFNGAQAPLLRPSTPISPFNDSEFETEVDSKQQTLDGGRASTELISIPTECCI